MSNSRLEKFIYAICSMEVSDLPAPLSRIEILWNCLITGETPDFEPQSRNEQYLMAMLGLYELDQLPTPMSRGEKLLYKIAMGETDLSDIPAYLSRYEELLGYLAENGGVGDFEYILQTLNQRLSTLYSTKERPMKQVVIKGDTLVNELPRPSLKNTMTNVASQKLNQGYDNGKTLVNLFKNKDYYRDTNKLTYVEEGDKIQVTFKDGVTNGWAGFKFIGNVPFEIGKTYTVINELYKCDNQLTSFNISLGNKTFYSTKTVIGNNKLKIIIPSDYTEGINWMYYNVTNTNNSATILSSKLLILEGDYTNEDIPYFEGTKTFSATPNVVDGEFKQVVVKGQTKYKIGEFIQDTFAYVQPLKTGQYLNWETGILTQGGDNHKYCEDYIPIPTGVTSIIAKGQNCWKKLCCYDSNKRYVSGVNGSEAIGTDLTLVIPSNAKYFRYSTNLMNGGDEYINIVSNTSLLIASSNTNIPCQLVSCGLSEVKTTGVNLYKDEGGKTNWDIVLATGYEQAANRFVPNYYTPVEPNSVFTLTRSTAKLNFGVRFYGKNKNYLTNITCPYTGGNKLTVTTPSNCYYIRFIDEYNKADNDYMIYKGDYTLDYNPYQSNTLTLAEPVTLRKVGDVEDEFDALTGQVTERVGEFVLDGKKQLIGKYDTVGNTVGFYYDIKMIKPKDTSTEELAHTCICDKVKVVDLFYQWSNDWKDEEFISIASDGRVAIRLLSTKASTIDEANRYLAENPITLYYQLGTKSTKTVNTTITDQDGATQTKLHSFNDGYLSVSSQGLFPSEVNYEVPTNNSYYLPDMLTLGAQYTSRGSADCNATIDGKLLALGADRIFTTPSTLTNRLMVLDAPVDDLMFIKGDQTAKDFGYFEGMKSVVLSNKMPVLTTSNQRFTILPYEIFENSNTSNYQGFTRIDFGLTLANVMCYIKLNSDMQIKILIDGFEEVNTNGGISKGVEYSKKLNNVSYIGFYNWGDIKYGNGKEIILSMLKNGELEIIFSKDGEKKYPHYSINTKSNILTVNEDITLRKVGDVQDTLDGLTSEVTERIGEIVLDGSENWLRSVDFSSLTNTVHFQIQSDTVGIEFGSPLISDKFINRLVWDRDIEGIYCATNGNLTISINRDKLSGLEVADFKKWISQNNVTVIGKATESVKTVDLTTVDQDGQPTKLKTFNDISYVEINADNLIPSVDVEVATKINETLATLDPQQLDISNTQNELGQTIDEQTENTDATMMATTEIYEQTL